MGAAAREWVRLSEIEGVAPHRRLGSESWSPFARDVFDRAILNAAARFEAWLQRCAQEKIDPSTYLGEA